MNIVSVLSRNYNIILMEDTYLPLELELADIVFVQILSSMYKNKNKTLT